MKKGRLFVVAVLVLTLCASVAFGCTKYSPYDAPEYTVTLDANGGEFSDGKSTHTQKVAEGGYAASETPTKSGGSFSGWYAEKSGLTAVDLAKTPVTADVTYYAGWSAAETLNVVFHYNYVGAPDDGVYKTVAVTEGSLVQKPTDPTRSGYRFVRWTSDAAGKTAWTFATYAVNTALDLYAQWEKTQDPVTPDIVSVSATNAKPTYQVGDTFDKSKITVEATLSDGSSRTLDASEYTVSDPDMSAVGSVTVTVTLKADTSVTDTFNITVTAAPVTVTAIMATSSKTAYEVNETFDKSKITVEATLSDGSSRTLDASEYTVSDPDMTVAADSVTVTVTLKADTSVTDTFEIEVCEEVIPEVVGLTVKLGDTPVGGTTVFAEDESFDPSALVVTAHYDNADEETLSAASYTVGAVDATVATEQTVTVTYKKNNSITATFKVQFDLITAIEVTETGNTSYVEGQKYDASGIVVTATYSVSGEKTLDADRYDVVKPDTTTAGNGKTVTVTLKGNNSISDSFTIDVAALAVTEITLKSLTLTNASQYLGEKFDPKGIVVRAHYNNGSVGELSLTDEHLRFESDAFDADGKLIKLGDFTVSVWYGDNIKAPSGVALKVIEHEVVAVTYTGALEKAQYNRGDAFDPKGLVFTAVYDNDAEKPVALNDVVFSGEGLTGGKLTAKGAITLTAKYKGVTATGSPIAVTVVVPTTLEENEYYLLGSFADNKWGTEEGIPEYKMTHSTFTTDEGTKTHNRYTISGIKFVSDIIFKPAQFVNTEAVGQDRFGNYKNASALTVNPVRELLNATVITSGDDYGNIKIGAVDTGVADRSWTVTYTCYNDGYVAVDITLENVDWRDPVTGEHRSDMTAVDAADIKVGDVYLPGNFTNNFNKNAEWSLGNTDIATKVGNVYYIQNVTLKAYDSFKICVIGASKAEAWYGINEKFALGKALALSTRNAADTGDADNIYVGAIADGSYNLVYDPAAKTLTVYAAKELKVALNDGVTIKVGETVAKSNITVKYDNAAVADADYTLIAAPSTLGSNTVTVIYNGAVKTVAYNALGEYSVTFGKNTTYASAVNDMPSNIDNVLQHSTLDYPEQVPTLKGYVFGGWYKESTCDTPWKFADRVGDGETADKVTSAVTLYAKWTAVEYSVAYELDGGVNGANPDTYTASASGDFESVTLANATKANYKFDGWYTAAENGEKTAALKYDVLPDSGNVITLYAKFTPITYTVTLDTESDVYTVKKADGAALVTTLKFTFGGAALTLPTNGDIKIEGKSQADVNKYYLVKWYLSGDEGKTAVTVVNDAYVAGKTYTGNAFILVAEIVAKQRYTVKFNYNYGETPTVVTKDAYEGETVAKIADPVRVGYRFVDWFDSATPAQGDTAHDFTAVVTGGFEVFAKWELKEYAVTYNVGDGAKNDGNPAVFTVETADFTLLNAAPATGYRFVGWYTAAEGGEKVTALTATMIDGNTQSIVLYARYSNKYTLSFDANADGDATVTGMPAAITDVEYNAAVTLPVAAPTRDNYTFGGWAKNADGTGIWSDADRMPANDLTLYAVWTENPESGRYLLVGDVTVATGTVIPEGHVLTDVSLNDGDTFKVVDYVKRTGVSTPLSLPTAVYPSGGNGVTAPISLELIGSVYTFTVADSAYVAGKTYKIVVDTVTPGDELAVWVEGYYGYRNSVGGALTDPTKVDTPENGKVYVIGNMTNGDYVAEWSSDNAGIATELDGVWYFRGVTLKKYDAVQMIINGAPTAVTVVAADGTYNIVGGVVYATGTLDFTYVADKPIYEGNAPKKENIAVTYNGEAVTDYALYADETNKKITVAYKGEITEKTYTVAPNVVTGIALTTEPTKKNYYVGDAIDLTGAVIELTYADGTEMTIDDFTSDDYKSYITVSDVPTVGNETRPTLAKQFAVTVSANGVDGVSATYNANVYNKATSIKVTTPPDTVEYVEGTMFSATGLVVTVYFNGGETLGFEPTTFTVDPAEGTVLTNITFFTVTYTQAPSTSTGLAAQTVSVKYNITVKAKAVSAISVKTAPEKTAYSIGEQADLTGLVIDVTYNDSTTATVAYTQGSNITVTYPSGGDRFANGDNYYTVTYGGQSANVNVSVSSLQVAFVKNVGYDTANAVLDDYFPTAKTITIYDQSLTVNNPVRGENDEYRFGGWFTDAACSAEKQWGTTDSSKTVGNVTTSMTLYAKWIAQANGGDNVAVGYEKLAPTDTAATVKYYAVGSAIALETPAVAGYTFGGWYTDAALETSFDTVTYTVWQEHTTLYAQWEPITYTVTYEVATGVVHANPTQYTAALGTVTLADPTALPVGKNFVEWRCGDSKITEITVAAFGEGTSITVTAVLATKTYTVSFDLVGGTGTAADYADQTIDHGETSTEPTEPTKTGYRFAGWKADGAAYDFATAVTADVSLVAEWVEQVTVSFDLNYAPLPDGVTAPQSVTVDKGGAVTRPTASREGYGFGGWFTSATPADDATEFDFTSVDATVTLYAKWTKNTIKVTFDAGEGAFANGKATFELSLSENTPIGDQKPNDPTRAGYRFDCWLNGSTPYTDADFDQSVTAPLTLTAKWVKTVTVTFDLNLPDGKTAADVANAPAAKTMDVGGAIVEEPTKPSMDDYVFNGWFEDAAGTKSWTFGETATFDADKTLYAKWTKKADGVMTVTSIDGTTRTLDMLDNTDNMGADEKVNYDRNYAFFGEHPANLKAGDKLTFAVSGASVKFIYNQYSKNITYETTTGESTFVTAKYDGNYDIYLKRFKSGNANAGKWELYAEGGTVQLEGNFYVVGEINGWDADNTDYKFDNATGAITLTLIEGATFKIVDGSKTGNDKWLGYHFNNTENSRVKAGAEYVQADNDNNFQIKATAKYKLEFDGEKLSITRVGDATKYAITVAASQNGTVTASKTEAAAGETITLTVTPAAGYKLDTLKYNDGADHAITGVTFVMPATAVTVTATFVEKEEEPVLQDGDGLYISDDLEKEFIVASDSVSVTAQYIRTTASTSFTIRYGGENKVISTVTGTGATVTGGKLTLAKGIYHVNYTPTTGAVTVTQIADGATVGSCIVGSADGLSWGDDDNNRMYKATSITDHISWAKQGYMIVLTLSEGTTFRVKESKGSDWNTTKGWSDLHSSYKTGFSDAKNDNNIKVDVAGTYLILWVEGDYGWNLALIKV